VSDDDTSVALPVGTYEDGLKYVGAWTEPVRADVPIDRTMIKAYAALIEDANPCYWDEEESLRTWGHVIAPPGLLFVVFAPLRWIPEQTVNFGALGANIPLPGNSLINAASEQTFHRQLRLGDWLSVSESIASISPLKQTSIGAGHFVASAARYFDESGTLVAESVNHMLRFQATEAQP